MVSFYIARSGKAAVEKLAKAKGQTKADTYRELLRLGLQQRHLFDADDIRRVRPPLVAVHHHCPPPGASQTGQSTDG